MKAGRVVNPSAVDYATAALRRAEGKYEQAPGLDLEDPVVDGLHVDVDPRPVVVLDPDRHAGSDGKRGEVAVAGTVESDDVELEGSAAEALQDRIEVNQRVIVQLELEIRPVVKFAHPRSVGGG